jgi:hypothetical protein
MFRGILIWTAFCLGLFMMWQLAAFAAERDRQYQQHYANQGQGLVDDPLIDTVPEPFLDAPRWHRCAPWSDACESHCNPPQQDMFSRLQ